MKTLEARALGNTLASLIHEQQWTKAYDLLAPVLAERTPFAMLNRIGAPIGTIPLEQILPFMDMIADRRTEGGWVVIAAALGELLKMDMACAFSNCQRYITAADIWYSADIFGERVPGPALLADFPKALALLSPWRTDANRWIRRTVGVAVHFWGKRSRDETGADKQAGALLDFLAPMFTEREMDAVKGVGWGLKTLGRYFPDLVTGWLLEQLRDKKPRALIIKKATLYLPPALRERVLDVRDK